MAPFLLIVILLAGCCAFSPAGEAEEREKSRNEGRIYQVPHKSRELPVLRENSTVREAVRYAFYSNPALEQAYFEWAAALERIPQAGSLDQPRFGFDGLFSPKNAFDWDRTTLGVSQMIPFPGKLEAAARIALEEAIAAGKRFENTKFMLQAQVVRAWYDLYFLDQSIKIAEEDLGLLKDFSETVRRLMAVGRARQLDVTKADLEVQSAENQVQALRSQRPAALAEVNRLLSRAINIPLQPERPREITNLPPGDDQILALAAERNPELQAMAAEIKGRENALDLARKQYLPDFEISLSLTGMGEKMLGAMLTFPLRLQRVRAGIAEAQASLRAVEAAARARRDDVRAQTIFRLYMARDTARQIKFLRDSLLVRAKEIVDATQSSYAAGNSSFLELLDAQRSLLELRLEQVRMQAMHEQSVAELEALCALDFGSLKENK